MQDQAVAASSARTAKSEACLWNRTPQCVQEYRAVVVWCQRLAAQGEAAAAEMIRHICKHSRVMPQLGNSTWSNQDCKRRHCLQHCVLLEF